MDASGLFRKITLEFVISAILAIFMGGMIYNAIASGIEDNKDVGKANAEQLEAQQVDVNQIKTDITVIKDDLGEVEVALEKQGQTLDDIRMMLIGAGYTRPSGD